MSSNRAQGIRILGVYSCAALVVLAPGTAVAQNSDGQATERIDILASPIITAEVDQRKVEECERQEEASSISGEIIVCRNLMDDQSQYYSGSREAAQRKYAEETAFRDDPASPNFINDCHQQGWPAGCVKMGKVPPPALIIDVTALPEAPPGSDADRIARGLPPLGNSGPRQPAPKISEEDLGLPPVTSAETVSPEG